MLKHDPGKLNGSHFNRELLRAAVADTYMEAVDTGADSMHFAIERSPVREAITGIEDSLFSRIPALSGKIISENAHTVMIAFNRTHEDFYGNRDSSWIHGWTGDHGITGRYSYLTASVVNRDMRLPLISIPSPMGNDMPSEITAMLDLLMAIFGHIDLLLFDR